MAIKYTSPFNLPYPDGNDPVRNGHTAIEGIAKGVNTALQNANIPPGNPNLNDVLARLNALEDRGYAEYYTTGFSVPGGNVSWDIGPLTNDGAKSFGNTFSNTTGALSGSINITKSGLYAVTVTSTPNGNPGAAHTTLKDNSGSALAMSFTSGYAWEMSPTVSAVYITAGGHIRATCAYTTGRTTASRLRIAKIG